jgi:hypothetical protein
MWLLVYILNEDRYLTEVLEELLEIGVAGASILDSVGMLHFLSQEIPIFAGFRSILKGTKPYNKIILSVIRDKELLEEALATIDRTVGGIEKGKRGILFSLPVDHLIGPGTGPRLDE